MWKRITGFFAVIAICIAILGGCAGNTPSPYVIPPGCQNSIIYNKLPYADVVGGLADIAGFATLQYLKQHKNLDIAPIITALQSLGTDLAAPGITYADFVVDLATVNNYVNQYAGIELIFADSLIDTYFNTKIAMDPCDVQYLQSQINNEVKLLRSM
jgi:hypothetical protein